MDKLFLDDPVSGTSILYSELIRDLNSADSLQPKYLQTNNIYDVFVSILVCLLCENQLVLLDSDFSEEEIKQLVPDPGERNQCAECVLSEPLLDYSDLVERLSRSKNAQIGFFTSGTTGLPKRVDHRLSTLARSVRRSPSHESAVWAFAYNPTHIAGCQVFLQAALNGNSIVNVFGLPRYQIYAALEEKQVTHISATPSFYRMLMPADGVLPSVRRVTFGGERMDTALKAKLEIVFPNAVFLNIYASTEAGTILAAQGDEFSIKPGLEDLVMISGNQLMVHRDLLGEFADASPVKRGEWYATGDRVAIISSDPLRFRIVHRENQMINVGGYKVNPEEVETVLREIPEVVDAKVYAKSNSVSGSMVCADVILLSDLSEGSIRRRLASKLQGFKIPRMVNFVDSLEKTRSGKLKRS